MYSMKSKSKEVESGIDSWLAELKRYRDENGPQFPSGSIPSHRVYPLFNLTRADPNVYFPALIASKLLELGFMMNEEQKRLSDTIIRGIASTFQLYKSRRGRMHYNFWPTKPDIPFPNGKFLRKLDFLKLPDDIDDTALVYDALQSKPDALIMLQQNIEKHFSDHYPDQPKLYAAWLGEKMPFVVDVSAMTNLLNLFNKSDLPVTEFSYASGNHLRKVILSRDYISYPYKVSPYYPDTAVIAYHLAKWISLTGDRREDLAQHMVPDLKALAENEQHTFRAMLYASSLLRLNTNANYQISFKQIKPFLPAFPWFFGSMLSAVKWKTLRKCGSWNIFHIAHVCEAWNFTLWVEYQLLKERARRFQ